MKIYTQDEYYPFQLLSETIEIDPEDTLLMEAVEEFDDILKELKDLEDTEAAGDISIRSDKIYSKFKKWWYSLDPDKKHKNLHKVFSILEKLLSIVLAIINIASGVRVTSNADFGISGIIYIISLILMLILVNEPKRDLEQFEIRGDELELFEKYIDSIDDKISKLEDKKKEPDSNKNRIDKTISKLKKTRNEIVTELKKYKRYELGRDKVDRGDFYEYGDSIIKMENLKLRDRDAVLTYVLTQLDVKDDKIIDKKSKTTYKDWVEVGGFIYTPKTITELKKQFRNTPYLFTEYNYDAIYGEGSHKKAMEKLKKEHPYDKIHETKNKNVKEYIKVHPDEFNEYIYDYFFGKGAHEKALKRYNESVELIDTAMTLIESGNIDAAQVLLSRVLSE